MSHSTHMSCFSLFLTSGVKQPCTGQYRSVRVQPCRSFSARDLGVSVFFWRAGAGLADEGIGDSAAGSRAAIERAGGSCRSDSRPVAPSASASRGWKSAEKRVAQLTHDILERTERPGRQSLPLCASLSLSLSRARAWSGARPRSLTSVLSLLLIRGTVHPFRGQDSDSMVHPCRSLSESLPTLSSVPFPAVIALDSTSFGTWYSSHLERALVGSPGSPPKGQGWRNRHRPDSKKQEKVRGARRQPGARGGGREGGCPRREGRGAEGRGLR